VGLCALAVLVTSANKSQQAILPPGADATTGMQLLHVQGPSSRCALVRALVAQWIVHESPNGFIRVQFPPVVYFYVFKSVMIMIVMVGCCVLVGAAWAGK
jgi:hypothetical protein